MPVPANAPKAMLPVTRGVVFECIKTIGSVEIAGGAKERSNTGGCILRAGGVVKERQSTDGYISRAVSVAKERLITIGCVAVADSIAKEPIIARSCVRIALGGSLDVVKK